MKIINIKQKIQKAIKKFITKIYKKIKSIDLLDGQRRGEIIFRRVFFLIAMAMLIYLFLLIVVGKKEDIDVEEVKAQEIVVEDKVEWVDGNRVTTKADASVEIVPAEVFMSKEQLHKLNEDKLKAQKIELFFNPFPTISIPSSKLLKPLLPQPQALYFLKLFFPPELSTVAIAGSNL